MTIRGWCPSLSAPMQSGDGWLLRVLPRRGILSAADARTIADVAAAHGNGIIELTNRGNLQIRGLTPVSARSFARDMLAAGLADPPYNILVSPLAGDDTAGIADGLDAALALAGPGALPDKFLLLVDGGGIAGMGGIRADIAARATDGQWSIWLDGAPLGAPCDPAGIPDAMARLANAFTVQAKQARRMRDLPFPVSLFAAAGLAATVPPRPATTPEIIGFLRCRADRGAFGLGVKFGQLSAATLKSLAGLAERFGNATLHLTPWRAVLLSGIAAADTAALRDAAREFITDPNDPTRRITACPGSPSCASASVTSRADAEVLASLRLSQLVHVSGCPKGCAHPGPSPITLVGTDGAYGIVRSGRAGDAPAETGLTLQQAAYRLAETFA